METLSLKTGKNWASSKLGAVRPIRTSEIQSGGINAKRNRRERPPETRRVSVEAQARAGGDSDLLLRGRSARAPCPSARCDRLIRRCCDGRGYGPTDEKTAILSEGDGGSGPIRAG